MKKTLAIATLMLLAVPAFAADIKVGFVNMKILLTQAPQIEDINRKLQEKFGSSKKDLDKIRESMQAQQEEIKRNELLMTEAKANKAKQDFMAKVQGFREKEQKLAADIQAFRNEELAELDKVVKKAVSDMAEAKKYDLIINDGVMYAAEKIDLTKDLLDRLKKARAAKK